MRRGRLLALSDLHIGHAENRQIVESLRPAHGEDWLLVAGDIAERYADIEGALRLLRDRFAKVVWAPGNHELWTHPSDPVKLRGEQRYRALVELCRDLGISTPEDPYPVWEGEGGPVTVAPLFVLYDYSFRAPGTRTKEESLQAAYDAGIVCADERFLHPDPHGSRDAWCRERVRVTEQRLSELPPGSRTVLVNHYPLVRHPTEVLHHPEFAQWCGTELTADWHRRFDAVAVVYGHLHIPRVTHYDGVRFEEVSLGYPREWKPRPTRPLLRQILPRADSTDPAPRLMAELVPPEVVTVETFHDPADPPDTYMFAEERAMVESAVNKRKREFATTRSCARKALSTLGHLPAPLLADRRGAPQWPEGVSGSLTHCHSYRAAAVAVTPHVASIGIDAEPNSSLPEGVLDNIALPAERELVRRLLLMLPDVRWDRLLFSAKESVFKAWYPLTRRELGFDEALIDIDPRARTISAKLLVPPPMIGGTPLDGFTGRWGAESGFLATAICVPGDACSPARHRSPGPARSR